ncbi:MAG: choice-of-anchor Q domain-containing protein [Thermomicrobiales bacterium]
MRRDGVPRIAVALVTVLLTLAAIPATPAFAATTYYVGTAGDGTGVVSDCATPSNIDCTLRDALAVAISGGDTVMFGTGFPSGTQTINIATNGTLTIAHTVTLIGPVTQTVAIDGGYNPTTHTGGVRVFDVTGTITFTMQNLTVQHGNVNGSGGGVRVSSPSTLAVTNCTFTANAASARGGAIYGNSVIASGTGGTVTVADSIFTGNAVLAGTVNDGGGAIYILNGLLTVTGSTFTGNTALSDNNGNNPEGGAIHIEEVDRTSPAIVSITGGSFANNNAADGGAVWDDFGLLTVTNVAFTDNIASGDSGAGTPLRPTGGAIFQGAGTLALSGGSLMTNTATAGPALGGFGGGIALTVGFDCLGCSGTVGTITGTTFTSNGNGTANGGAIYVRSSSVSVVQSTFTTNLSYTIFQEKGATTINGSTFVGNTDAFASENLFSETSTATIINSTFSGNTGVSGVLSDNATTTTIINSTFYGNSSVGIYQWYTCCSSSHAGAVTLINTLVGGSGNDLYTDGPTPSAVFLGHNNLIDNAASAGPFTNGTANNKVGVPAGVGPLGSNGGPTQTRPLLAGSAAIGAGDTTACASAPPNGAGGVDQRGLPRPSGTCSIGGFEPQPVPNPLPPPKPAGPSQVGPPAPLPVPPQPPGPNLGLPAPLPSRRP